MNREQLELELLGVIVLFDGQLPVEQLDDMRALVNAGEPGVALENLCTQIDECDLVVPLDVATRLERLGSAMGIDERYRKRS